ncbi:MAG: hypothetical protein ACRDBG_04535 [Waterburya sp.]
MNSKEIDLRLAEINIFIDYILSRIEHLANHQEYARTNKEVEKYQAKQEQCKIILKYLENRKSILKEMQKNICS